jgi:hypothetical protein
VELLQANAMEALTSLVTALVPQILSVVSRPVLHLQVLGFAIIPRMAAQEPSFLVPAQARAISRQVLDKHYF